MNRPVTYLSSSEADTEFAGHCLARVVQSPLVIALCGTLGAGKTRFVKGFACELDVDESSVVSPTFSIVNHYPGRQRIQHLDIYRVADTDEMFELGVDEMFESDALTLVEWGDRFPECLPDIYLLVDFRLVDEQSREIVFQTIGDLPSDLPGKLEAELSRPG